MISAMHTLKIRVLVNINIILIIEIIFNDKLLAKYYWNIIILKKMKLITKQIDYAIRILGSMAREKDIMHTTTSLAEKLKISRPFVRGILQKLNKENIVVSSKGKSGGFKFEADPHKISIISIIEIFDGPVKLDNCLIGNKVCPDTKTCLLKKKLKEMSNYINSEFKSLTLAELLNQ